MNLNTNKNESEQIKEIPKIIPCECNTGNAHLIEHDLKTGHYIYECKNCNSKTYV